MSAEIPNPCQSVLGQDAEPLIDTECTNCDCKSLWIKASAKWHVM